MATKWLYATNVYTTQEAADAAVVAQKYRLDNNPTDWAVVKELTGNASDGWVVPSLALTDSEINTLDDAKHYSVASVWEGNNYLGLTATEADAKILELRVPYAQRIEANTIYTVDDLTNNIDMSDYVA